MVFVIFLVLTFLILFRYMGSGRVEFVKHHLSPQRFVFDSGITLYILIEILIVIS